VHNSGAGRSIKFFARSAVKEIEVMSAQKIVIPLLRKPFFRMSFIQLLVERAEKLSFSVAPLIISRIYPTQSLKGESNRFNA
jgi:hypothetical protein